MTMVELLLSLTITSLVALATATMMVGVSYGTTSRSQMREVGVRLKIVSSHLNAAMRGSKMILDSGTDYVILWTADTHTDDGPNPSELRLIQRDPSTCELRSYQVDFDAMTDTQIEAVDIRHALTDDFVSVTNMLKSGSMFPSTVWARHVSAFACSYVGDDPQAASLINYRLTVTHDGFSSQCVESVALRNR